MNDIAAVATPLVSLAAGALITYYVNVRNRRQTKIEDVFHQAIEALAVAKAAHSYIDTICIDGATKDEQAAFDKQLRWDNHNGFVRAEANARTAIARASAYDERLSEYATRAGQLTQEGNADEIIRILRQGIDKRR